MVTCCASVRVWSRRKEPPYVAIFLALAYISQTISLNWRFIPKKKAIRVASDITFIARRPDHNFAPKHERHPPWVCMKYPLLRYTPARATKLQSSCLMWKACLLSDLHSDRFAWCLHVCSDVQSTELNSHDALLRGAFWFTPHRSHFCPTEQVQ